MTHRFHVQTHSDTPEEAAEYWASADPYIGKAPWSERIADAVAAHEPSAVLEFGANAGRNLVAIRARIPEASLVGIDVNAEAVGEGKRRWDLDLRVGDVNTLEGLVADVAFTVSVIDHLPEPETAIRLLAKVAPTLILWEPWTGSEGRITRRAETTSGVESDMTPYSYSWDYRRLAADAGLTVESEAVVEMETRLGPYYRMYHLTR